MPEYDFSGVWRSTYYHESDRRGPGMYESTHLLMAQRRGSKVIFQSLPEKDGSFLLARLNLDGRIASGGWEEQTSPDGPFKGARFYGPLQLVLDEDGQAFHGLWLGVGMNMYVKSGKWEIVHEIQAPAAKHKGA
jgi:hypothetical protein